MSEAIAAPVIEKVMVIPRRTMVEIAGPFQGFRPVAPAMLPQLLAPSRGAAFFDRPRMEEDPEFKQIIPYIVFINPLAEVYVYRRTPKGGESRLHGKRSVGIGGHINPVDGGPGMTAFEAAVGREISEELTMEATLVETRSVGLINDDSNPVGSVHLAVVQIARIMGAMKAKGEDHADDGFYALPDLVDDIDSFETWSQIVIRQMVSGELR